MLREALMSLSAVPGRRVDSNNLSATNCNAGGTISLVPLTDTLSPRSSTNAEMSIKEFSKDSIDFFKLIISSF